MQSFTYLFNSFYRYFGNPIQTKISSLQELLYYMSLNTGKNPCFVSFNSFQNGYTVCRSIFNDFDAEFKLKCKSCGHEFKESPTPRCTKCGNLSGFEKESKESKRAKVIEKIKQAQKLARTLRDYKIPCVPHFTAYKGIHLLPLFRPEKFTNSELITSLYYFFIEQSKCYYIDTITEIIEGKKKEKLVKVPQADTKVVSDLRRLCRLPGTKRPETGLYCIAIQPEDFLNMESEKVFDLARYPTQSVEVGVEPRMKMSEFEFEPVDITKFRQISVSSSEIDPLEFISDDIKQYIRDIFPPCLQKLLPTVEPPHEVRYNAVIHLRDLKMSPSGIMDFMSKIGWRDYSYDTTNYQVHNIYQDRRCRFKCYEMRLLGACNTKDCNRMWR